jgi:hypothetical protein
MKLLYVLIFVSLICSGLYAQNESPDQLRKKMSEIRENTDWDNPSAAKKANEEIKKLSKKLMISGSKGKTQEEKEEEADGKMMLLDQMMKTARQGEEADILLATPFREEIIEEFRDDESPHRPPEYLDDMTVLCLDMSLPTIKRTIEQMEYYKSVKILIVTGGKYGSPVNLEDLLKKASGYPLKELYIINFRNFVTSLPDGLNKFKELSVLSLMNNNLTVLPALNTLKNLETLYLDINPLSSVLPAVNDLTSLRQLGIAKTGISNDETNKLKQALPECEILTE